MSAVESGVIPISLAIVISKSSDSEIQEALADAYTEGKLKGKKLSMLKRLLEQRAVHGKLARRVYPGKRSSKKMTPAQLVKTLEREVAKNALLSKKAEYTHGVLSFVIEAFRELMSIPDFQEILKREGIDTLPKPLEERMARRGIQ